LLFVAILLSFLLCRPPEQRPHWLANITPEIANASPEEILIVSRRSNIIVLFHSVMSQNRKNMAPSAEGPVFRNQVLSGRGKIRICRDLAHRIAGMLTCRARHARSLTSAQLRNSRSLVMQILTSARCCCLQVTAMPCAGISGLAAMNARSTT